MNPQQQQMAAQMLRQGGGQGMPTQQAQIPPQIAEFGRQVMPAFERKYGAEAAAKVAAEIMQMPPDQMMQTLQQIAQSLQGGQEPPPMPQQGQNSSMGDIQGY